MSGREILFNYPQGGFLLLLLLPLFYVQFALKCYRQRQQQTYASSTLLPHLLIPRSSSLTYTKIVGWMLIWTLLCVAFMQPFGDIHYSSFTTPLSASQTKAYQAPHEIIFLVDTSASMGVPDGLEGETRLEESKILMEDVIRQLRGQTIALYAFTSELSAVVPATLDYLFVRLSIKELHIDEGDIGGTRFAPILTALKQQVFPEPTAKHYTVILLSDGGDTQLEALTGAEREQEKRAILTAIRHPQQLKIRLLTVGLGALKSQPIPHVTSHGKPVLSKLEPTILKELAAQERGLYYTAKEWTSWNLAQEIISQINEDTSIEQTEVQIGRQVVPIKNEDILIDLYYQVPLGFALLFYFFNFLLPDVRRL